MATEEKKFLGTAAVERLIANTREEFAAADAAALAEAKKYAEDLGVNYDAAGTAATKVQELANGQVKANTEHIGTMDNLETTAKGDLVNAINEVRNAVSAGGTAAAITMEEKSSDLGEGILKAYVLKQGTNTVGTINIPKDMVVQSGEVVQNPAGQPEGTYIKLVLANATNDVIYVNVGNLVDIYKAKASAAQVQLAIDAATREISATIVAGSVTATELAANAVTTVKIADGNVTKAKLSTEVQTELQKLTDWTTEGSWIYVEINDAYRQALGDAKAYTDEFAQGVASYLEEGGTVDQDIAQALQDAKTHANGLNTAMDNRVKVAEAALADGGAVDQDIAQALQDAKDYADSKVEGVDLTGIATNASDIDKLEASLAEGGATANAIADAKKAGTDAAGAVTTLENGKVADLRTDVDALKAVSYVEITADEIDAMFES